MPVASHPGCDNHRSLQTLPSTPGLEPLSHHRHTNKQLASNVCILWRPFSYKKLLSASRPSRVKNATLNVVPSNASRNSCSVIPASVWRCSQVFQLSLNYCSWTFPTLIKVGPIWSLGSHVVTVESAGVEQTMSRGSTVALASLWDRFLLEGSCAFSDVPLVLRPPSYFERNSTTAKMFANFIEKVQQLVN